MIIAIDGPAGSGKSTVSKVIAKTLGFLYLDTGAMYRALTLKVIESGVNPKDEVAVIDLAKKLDFKFDKDGKVFLDGRDVTGDIRTPHIEKVISDVCKIPAVREKLVDLQRKIASFNSCVTEGRDTTTVVFPKAQVKVFLDADISERAKRRLEDFKNKDMHTEVETVRDDLARRDNADYTRSSGPLKKASDANVIDTTGLSIEQVVEKILAIVKTKN
jgi:cytidylate kinase